MKTYEEGLENAGNFIPPGEVRNLTAAIRLIDYLKSLALEHNKPHLAGIADGVWQIISQVEFDKEELIKGISMPAPTVAKIL